MILMDKEKGYKNRKELYSLIKIFTILPVRLGLTKDVDLVIDLLQDLLSIKPQL